MPSTTRFAACLVVLLVAGCVAASASAHEIHEAARTGDLARVEALVTADPTLATLADGRDCRPLHFACDGGHVPVMEFLVEAGADLTVVDVDGDTPLHWAAYAQQDEAVRWLAARGAPLDALNLRRETPLLYAVKRRGNPAIAALVAAGADLEITDEYGRTALLWVTRETNDVPTVRLLMEQGANVDVVDVGGETALSLAAWRGFRILVGLYLDAGADLHVGERLGDQTLQFAFEKGLDRLYGELVAAGMSVEPGDATGKTHLHTAAVGGSRTIVEDLLARGFPVDSVDAYGWSPLHHAADKQRDEVVGILLDAGADPLRHTLSGYSARDLAARAGSASVVELLETRGGDPGPRRFPELAGPYLDQGAPPARPSLFAPDIVATPHGGHSSITFSPDGREAFWHMYVGRPDSGYYHGTVFTSRLENDRWTAPDTASFCAEWSGDVPFISPDGQRLFFVSSRPLEPGAPGNRKRMWVCDREGERWSEPRPLSAAVNAMSHHWQFSVAADGDLYFSSRRGGPETAGVYVSRPVDGVYTEPEFLGFPGEAPFVLPDGSCLLTCRFDGGRRILARFRRPDGSWGEPVNVTATVGEEYSGICPAVSPDGKRLFMLKAHDGNMVLWWVDAGFLEDLRAEAHGATLAPDLRYLGQTPPGSTPEKFAPDLISTDRWEASGTFSPAGDEYFFTRRPTHGGSANRLWWTRVVDGAWTDPEPAPFGVEAMEFEPHITPDGSRLYFNSKRRHPSTGSTDDCIWYVDRTADGWGQPQYLDDAVNDGWAMYVSVDREETLYFTGMYDRVHGIFMWREGDERPVPLPEGVNGIGGASHPFIEPTGRFLIFDAQPTGMGRTALYISRRTDGGGWEPARKLGPEINASETENCASLSPDGRYLFFYREGDIWWVDAEVLEPFLAD